MQLFNSKSCTTIHKRVIWYPFIGVPITTANLCHHRCTLSFNKKSKSNQEPLIKGLRLGALSLPLMKQVVKPQKLIESTMSY